MPPETGTGLTLPVVEPLPSSPEKLLPQHDATPELASMHVCAEPAEIVGWTVGLGLGPVESLQALDMAAAMAQETADTLGRMLAANITFLFASGSPPQCGQPMTSTSGGKVTRTAATPPDPPPRRGARAGYPPGAPRRSGCPRRSVRWATTASGSGCTASPGCLPSESHRPRARSAPPSRGPPARRTRRSSWPRTGIAP